MNNEDTYNSHLERFADSFVVMNKKDRWGELFNKYLNGKNVTGKLNQLENSLNIKSCEILEGASSFPDNLISKIGNVEGIYFDFYEKPNKCFLAEIIDEAFSRGVSIFSINPGEKAVVFTDESLVFYFNK